MATGKITKTAVESIPLPAPSKRAHLWDATLKGFGVMVTDKGSRSYIVQYRIGGRGRPTRRVTIGGHGNPWTAETAREYAQDILHQVRRGIDPFATRKKQREEERTEIAAQAQLDAQNSKLIFSKVAAEFVHAARTGGLDYQKKKALKSWLNIEGFIKRDLLPVVGDKPLPQISVDELTDLIEGVSERSPASARLVYDAAAGVFRYASNKYRRIFPPSASPMSDIPRPKSADSRDRFLSDDELRKVWVAADGLGWPFSEIYKLLILTGQRLNEVAGAAWTEFDLEKQEWLIPANRTKNGRPNLVHLTETAVQIISSLPRLASDGQFLFTTNGKTPVSGFSRAKRRLDSLILKREGAEIDSWVTHDFRRTLAVGCQQMGIKLEVTEEVLNHKSGSRSGIVGVYQTYKFQPEKRSAWEAWDNRVRCIVQGDAPASNVVSIGDVA